MKRYVLDANALVRLYRDIPGADAVDNLLRQAKAGRAQLSISVINLAEVLYILTRYLGNGKARQCIETALAAVEAVPANVQMAMDAASLRSRYKLGLAECFAAELAIRTNAALVTADPEFAKLGKQLKVLALPRHSV